MIKITLAILLVLILGGPKQPNKWQRAESSGGRDPEVDRLMNFLWSPDEAVRNSAKAKLVQAGPRAGPYLISLIEDVANHPEQHRFATGREREGELYYEDPLGHADMAKFVLYWRLIYDCIDVLGDLRYSEGAPIIIRILAEKEPHNMVETMGTEHYALVKIGGPAVPPLIDAIKNASSIAESIWGDTTRIRLLCAGSATQLAGRIRQRAAMALGDIGDARAIPVLEDLLKPGQQFEHGNAYVGEALRALRSRRQVSMAASGGVAVPSGTEVNTLVKELWSPDDLVRQAAKAGLGKIGPEAAPYLISLLSDLVDYIDDPHFATGKEQEGETYWRNPVGHVDFFNQFEITGRLALDCTGLLGDMRSEEAVPIIVRLMEQDKMFGAYESRAPEAQALVKIGEPAVLPLIDALSSAPSIAASICADRNQRLPDNVCSSERLADRIRLRAAGALGAIGDARALPALARILEPGGPPHNKAIDTIVETAIRRIRSHN